MVDAVAELEREYDACWLERMDEDLEDNARYGIATFERFMYTQVKKSRKLFSTKYDEDSIALIFKTDIIVSYMDSERTKTQVACGKKILLIRALRGGFR